MSDTNPIAQGAAEAAANTPPTTAGSTPAVGADTPQEQVVNLKTLYQTCLVIALVCSALSVFIYDKFMVTKIATLDLPGYMSQIGTAMAAGAMTEQQMLEAVTGAEKAVNSVPKNYVVISGDVVLGKATKVLKLKLPDVPKVAPQSAPGAGNGSGLNPQPQAGTSLLPSQNPK